MKNLTILTGASSGIGFHIAQNLKGQVITCSRTTENIFENKNNVRYIKTDLGIKEEQKTFIDAIVQELHQKKYSSITLVLNAAIIGNEELDGTYHDEDYVWETNYFSNIRLVNEMLKFQLSIQILFVSSGTTKLAEIDPRIALYVATKRAMETFLESIKKNPSVEVMVFIPGITNTRLHTAIINSLPGVVTQRHQAAVQLRQVRNPQVVAKIMILAMGYKFLRNILLEASHPAYAIFSFLFFAQELSFVVFCLIVFGSLLSLITPSYNLTFYPAL